MANSSRKEYVEAAKAAFLNLAKKQVLSGLAAQYGAWIVTGPWGIVIGIVVNKILGLAIEKGDTGIFFLFVDFRVGDQEGEFTRAAIDHYRLQTSGTQEQKDEAEKKLIDAFDIFVKFNRY